jgi:hypothetical protein
MEWIKVEDRLPKENETVIVAWPEHCALAYMRDNLFYPAHPAPWTLPVTHWMPLPELPLKTDSK